MKYCTLCETVVFRWWRKDTAESCWFRSPTGRVFQVDGPAAAKLYDDETDGPGCGNCQVTTNGWAQITTDGVLRNWLTHGDQVSRCDAVQTVEHQDTQLEGNALTHWQPVHNITKRVRNAINFSLSDDQSCRSTENSLELSQMNDVCTC